LFNCLIILTLINYPQYDIVSIVIIALDHDFGNLLIDVFINCFNKHYACFILLDIFQYICYQIYKY